jgi:hypothetical protein
MSTRFGLMEMDHKKYNMTFLGLTREDVEDMLKFKVEREELNRQLADLQRQMISVN